MTQKMTLAQNPITQTLEQHAQRLEGKHLSSLMVDPARAKALQWSLDDLMIDATRADVDLSAWHSLLALAEASDLVALRQAMFDGQPINSTEQRAVEHCALRDPVRYTSDAWQQLTQFVHMTQQMGQFDAVVNLGIGGSDLGPAMVAKALSAFHQGLTPYFVSNVDPAHLADTLRELNPQRTLVVVTSKTFTTAETLANAALAKQWLIAGNADPLQAMVAVSANPAEAANWGIAPAQIFDFADGVGGRYSLWSAVGIAVMLSIGVVAFQDFLAGAHAMDRHYADAPIAQNLPVLMALLRIWQRNFRHRPSYGIMPYDQRLNILPAWAQQLEMESNGKRVDHDGAPLQHDSAPLIWGEAGTNAQHSFFQYLHQGTDIVPLDILLPRQATNIPQDESWQHNHQVLAMNAIAQAEALAFGAANSAEPHRHFVGNRPSVMISWRQSDPYAIGRLLALYEHITTSCGFLWGLNSFDQWGVELGKSIALKLLAGGDYSQFSQGAQALLLVLEQEKQQKV